VVITSAISRAPPLQRLPWRRHAPQATFTVKRNSALVTGSSGLVGSEMVAILDREGWAVHGLDNNMRRDFFGPDGDTTANRKRLLSATKRFEHHELDVRDREGVGRVVAEVRPDLIVHCAAQPSHDLAARRPFDDFEVNATGTLNLLEAARVSCPESPFVFLSTNKVYGDSPNELELVELETRYDYADPDQRDGIDETCRIDSTTHSLFGASKAAADLLVQEYGRYFGMPTVCFRARITRVPSSTGSSPTSHGACSRAAPTASTATRGSRSGTTCTRRTSVRRHSRLPGTLGRAPSTTWGVAAATPFRSSKRSSGSKRLQA